MLDGAYFVVLVLSLSDRSQLKTEMLGKAADWPALQPKSQSGLDFQVVHDSTAVPNARCRVSER
jgi:hypothetical protein